MDKGPILGGIQDALLELHFGGVPSDAEDLTVFQTTKHYLKSPLVEPPKVKAALRKKAMSALTKILHKFEQVTKGGANVYKWKWSNPGPRQDELLSKLERLQSQLREIESKDPKSDDDFAPSGECNLTVPIRLQFQVNPSAYVDRRAFIHAIREAFKQKGAELAEIAVNDSRIRDYVTSEKVEIILPKDFEIRDEDGYVLRRTPSEVEVRKAIFRDLKLKSRYTLTCTQGVWTVETRKTAREKAKRYMAVVDAQDEISLYPI